MNLWIHRKFSKLRPGADDSVKTCGHQHAVWFFFDATSPLDRMRWIGLCQSCFVLYAHEPETAVEKFAATQPAA